MQVLCLPRRCTDDRAWQIGLWRARTNRNGANAVPIARQTDRTLGRARPLLSEFFLVRRGIFSREMRTISRGRHGCRKGPKEGVNVAATQPPRSQTNLSGHTSRRPADVRKKVAGGSARASCKRPSVRLIPMATACDGNIHVNLMGRPTHLFHLSCQFTAIVMAAGATSGVTLLTRNR